MHSLIGSTDYEAAKLGDDLVQPVASGICGEYDANGSVFITGCIRR
jgi:hypothetical protein